VCEPGGNACGDSVAAPFLRVAEASTVESLISSTVPVGLPPDLEETCTAKLAPPQPNADSTAGIRLTVTGVLIAATVTLSDTLSVA